MVVRIVHSSNPVECFCRQTKTSVQATSNGISTENPFNKWCSYGTGQVYTVNVSWNFQLKTLNSDFLKTYNVELGKCGSYFINERSYHSYEAIKLRRVN